VQPKPLQTPAPVVIRSDELVLREWQDDDIPHMVKMFDTAEMERWTPLAHPFDVEAAKDFLRSARQGREWGLLQLAITDGGEPLGEVRLFPCDDRAMVEYAYAVGSDHRGHHLASRAVVATFPLARDEGYSVARIRVPIDNVGSVKVARDAGFGLTDEPLIRHDARGYVYALATWVRRIV
jgi:RimJ/RimL family protein N-acetyltransferase